MDGHGAVSGCIGGRDTESGRAGDWTCSGGGGSVRGDVDAAASGAVVTGVMVSVLWCVVSVFGWL